MDRPLVKSGELSSRHSGNFVASPLPRANVDRPKLGSLLHVASLDPERRPNSTDEFEPRGLQDDAANVTKHTNPPITVTKVSPLFGRAHNFQTWWSTSGHGPRSGAQNTACEHVPAHFCHLHDSNLNMELLFGGSSTPFCHCSNFKLEPETTFRSSPAPFAHFSGFRFEPETVSYTHLTLPTNREV